MIIGKPSLGELNRNDRTAIWLVNLLALFFIFRAAIPSFKFLFALTLAILIIYTLYGFNQKITFLFYRIKSTLSENIFVIVLSLYLFVAYLLTDEFYISVIKDLLNVFLLFIIFWFYYLYVPSRGKLRYTLHILIKLNIYFSVIISVVLLLDLFDVYSINKFNSVENPNSYIDNNFSLLPIFFGIFSVFYSLRNEKSIIRQIGYDFLLVIFSIPILFSGSKRGLILYFLIYLIALIFSILKACNKKVILDRIGLNFSYFPISVPILIFLLTMFFLESSYFTKNKLFDFIGTNNKELVRIRIAAGISRVAKTANQDLNYINVYNSIWKTVFDPKNPESGWGTRIHKNVYPLAGKNVSIVPENSIGYYMDNTCDASYYSDVDVSESYSLVFQLKVQDGEFYRVSVFCYLSEDFDGSDAYLMLGDSDAFKEGFRRVNYPLNKKGSWQKLEIEFQCADGTIPVYIAFMKKGVKSFSDLTGHIIFAYPQFESINSINYNKILNSLLDPLDPQSGWGGRNHKRMFPLIGKKSDMIPNDCIGYQLDSTCNASYYANVNASEAYSLLYQLNVKQNDHYKITVFCFVSDDFDGTSAYLMLGDSKA